MSSGKWTPSVTLPSGLTHVAAANLLLYSVLQADHRVATELGAI